MANNGVVLVTVNSPEMGEAIARAIVAEKLAACVNLYPVQSIYAWQGAIQQDSEWQLVIKTDLDYFDQLQVKITAMHPYDVPEIIAIAIVQGSPTYLQWLGENVAPVPLDNA
jgi:periplasmic divalent cation tolerance protein